MYVYLIFLCINELDILVLMSPYQSDILKCNFWSNILCNFFTCIQYYHKVPHTTINCIILCDKTKSEHLSK